MSGTRSSSDPADTTPRAVRELDPLFRPGAVAVIGLSRAALGSPVSVLTTLTDFGYRGRIVVVNPNMPAPADGAFEVCGSLDDLPAPVDLAIVSVARERVLAVMEECARNRIPAAIVITQGFADADEEGGRLQRELVALCERTGLRVLGPNTIGISNAVDGFTSSFIEVHRDDTPVGIVSQSGLFTMGHLLVNNEPAGFCMAADLGNGCDIDIAEVLDYFEHRDEVRVIEAHVEGIADGPGFIESAARVGRAKPIVLLKAGRTRAGRMAVASHSGAAAGEDEIYAAAFRRAGVVTASNAEELRLLAKAFVTYRPPPGGRVAIVSFSGGGAILAIDAVERAGLELATLSEATARTIRDFFPPWMEVVNPVDVWIPVSRDFHAAFPAILEAVLRDEGVDAVICIYCSYTLPKYADFDSSLYLGPLAAKYPGTPVLCWSYGMDIAGFSTRVEASGPVIVFRSLEEATGTVSKLLGHERFRRRAESPAEAAPPPADDARIAEILRRAAAAGDGHIFLGALEILRACDVDVIDSRLACDEDELIAAAHDLGYPLCLKVVSPAIVHKSDHGGIVLGIPDRDRLVEAYRSLRAKVTGSASAAEISGVLVQPMAGGGKEVMIGAKRDPVFGPCIVLGAGGIYTEVLGDHAFRLAPVDEDEALSMVDELRLAPILRGARGEPPCDLRSIAAAVARISRLMCAHPAIREIDVNPMFVDERAGTVVDARVIL